MSLLVVVATFLAAGVEWVEALTIVLAVGIYRGWRSAMLGTVLAVLALAVLVAGFGVALSAYVPIALIRTLVGVFLLLFGLKWLHKAILRSSGLKSLHDEAKAFEKTREQLGGKAPETASLDWRGAATSFNGVFLEGLEVVFIVIALGGLNSISGAMIGALASAVVVIAVGVAVRQPLTRVPENLMKYVVGVMLTAFGTFFVGEGIGVQWWNADLSLLPLIATYAIASVLLVAYLRSPRAPARRIPLVEAARAVAAEVWGLFVDDGALAIVAVAVMLAVALFLTHIPGAGMIGGVLLTAGVVVAVLVGLAGPARKRPQRAPAEAADRAPARDPASV
jgi:Ca2+/H+ antiporter, TMEM165/GDT1 family